MNKTQKKENQTKNWREKNDQMEDEKVNEAKTHARQDIKTHINSRWISRIPHQFHEHPSQEIRDCVLFAVTCNRQFETILYYRKTTHRIFCKFHT